MSVKSIKIYDYMFYNTILIPEKRIYIATLQQQFNFYSFYGGIEVHICINIYRIVDMV